jgi:hypothetical protein
MIVIKVKPLGWAVLACLSAGGILVPLSQIRSVHNGTSVAVAADEISANGFSAFSTLAHVQESSPAAIGALSADALAPGQLPSRRELTFRGRVSRTFWTSGKSARDVAFVGRVAGEAPVVAEIDRSDFARFPDPDAFIGQTLLVTGSVGATRGHRAVIRLTSTDQVMSLTLSRH